jgi:hypothetical protein
MEHGDVARLLNVADADLRHYVENDDSVSVVLTDGVERLWTSDGVFAVNDCPQNRSLRPVPDELKREVYWVGETGPEALVLPEGAVVAPIPGLPEAAEDESKPDYGSWTPKELRAELAKRGLPTNGQTATLIARLQEADAK